MIAKTVIGNNALGIGLLTHIAAITVTAVPLGNTDEWNLMVYIFGTFLMSVGIFSELLDHQKTVLKSWHFYAASALSLLAFIGPLFSCWILYTASNEKESQKSVGGFIRSLLGLKIHPLILFIWLTAGLAGLTLLFYRYDPYFSRITP